MKEEKSGAKTFIHLNIGVLGIQGAVTEHLQTVASCGARPYFVRSPSMLEGLDGLILPGGESTTIGRLIRRYGYDQGIFALAERGRPIWGTCAGMVLLAREVENQAPLLGLMDIMVRRNAYGRQRESFEAPLNVQSLGPDPFTGVFIRAPIILSAGQEVEVLARFQEQIVAARQDHYLATSFHPELTDDLRFHRLFLQMALETASNKKALSFGSISGRPFSS